MNDSMNILADSIKKISLDKIITWQNTSLLAEKIFIQEYNILNKVSSKLSGAIIIQLLINQAYDLDIQNKFSKSYKFSLAENNKTSSIIDPENLPIIPNIIDLIVMPHILEICYNPRIIIKEVSNALMPSGKLLLSGFNPISFVNLVKPLNNNLRCVFADIDFIKADDLTKILAEYDLEVEEIKYSGFLFSDALYDSYLGNKIEYLLTSKNIPTGFCYTILATKKKYCSLSRKMSLKNFNSDIYPSGVANPGLGSTFE